MRKNIVVISILSLLGMAVLSCATISKGTKQLITVNSNVVDADVYIDGIKVGVTPFTGEIKKAGKLLELRKSGYKTYQLALTTNLEGMFWGNIITGGTLGSLTDFASGAAWAYSPASFQVEMLKEGMSLLEFEKTVNLKKFAMLNMSNISKDLAEGNGEHLSALLQLSGLENTVQNVELIRSVFKNSRGNQANFASDLASISKF